MGVIDIVGWNWDGSNTDWSAGGRAGFWKVWSERKRDSGAQRMI